MKEKSPNILPYTKHLITYMYGQSASSDPSRPRCYSFFPIQCLLHSVSFQVNTHEAYIWQRFQITCMISLPPASLTVIFGSLNNSPESIIANQLLGMRLTKASSFVVPKTFQRHDIFQNLPQPWNPKLPSVDMWETVRFLDCFPFLVSLALPVSPGKITVCGSLS